MSQSRPEHDDAQRLSQGMLPNVLKVVVVLHGMICHDFMVKESHWQAITLSASITNTFCAAWFQNPCMDLLCGTSIFLGHHHRLLFFMATSATHDH